MIGIYDSGVGGLPVLRRVREFLPDADLTYLADQAHVPYGERPLDEVRRLADTAVGALVAQGATTVIVACNSASAAALELLRSAYPDTSIVGVEPAVKPAAAATRSKVIGVLATDATFAADRFRRLVDRFAAGVEVVPLACPGWAASIETTWPDGAEPPVREHIAPLLDKGVDTLVLGCTHYTFVTDVIARIAGADVLIIDPVDPVAQQAVRVAHPGGAATTRYLTTSDPARFAAQVTRLVGEQVEVERA